MLIKEMTYASILVEYFKDVLTCTAQLVGLGSLERST
jgi:hypothetical protein